MNETEIPYELFICPQCKTKLNNNNQELSCPLCKKEVLRDGRYLDFSKLTPRLSFHFADYLKGLYNISGQKETVDDTWRIQKIVKRLPAKERGSVCLEIGGADGPLTPTLEGKYSIVFTIDLSMTCLRRIELKTTKTFCLFGDGQFLPLADRSVDVIICTEVLEHVLIPTQLLLEIRRILKPDGCCLLSVPNETIGFFSDVLKNKEIQTVASDAHVNFYNTGHLKKILFRMGFEILEIRTIGEPLSLKKIVFLPVLFLIKGGRSIHSHILCIIQNSENPDVYWQSLEKNI